MTSVHRTVVTEYDNAPVTTGVGSSLDNLYTLNKKKVVEKLPTSPEKTALEATLDAHKHGEPWSAKEQSAFEAQLKVAQDAADAQKHAKKGTANHI
jgi:hypothetical protein